MIGQEIGLRWLLPIAVQVLVDNPLADGDMYAGDLLSNVIRSAPQEYWADEPALRKALVRALEQLDPHTVEEEGADRIVRTALDRLRGPAP